MHNLKYLWISIYAAYCASLCSCHQIAALSFAKENNKLKHCRNIGDENKVLYSINSKAQRYARTMDIRIGFSFKNTQISSKDFMNLYRSKTGKPLMYSACILNKDKQLLRWELKSFDSNPWILLYQ